MKTVCIVLLKVLIIGLCIFVCKIGYDYGKMNTCAPLEQQIEVYKKTIEDIKHINHTIMNDCYRSWDVDNYEK